MSEFSESSDFSVLSFQRYFSSTFLSKEKTVLDIRKRCLRMVRTWLARFRAVMFSLAA